MKPRKKFREHIETCARCRTAFPLGVLKGTEHGRLCEKCLRVVKP